MQAELSELVAIHGRRPCDGPHLWKEIKAGWGSSLGPAVGLAARLHPRARDLERPPARNGLHPILRDWDLIGFYLPFGWPLLSLARIFRRPPYGYRGLRGQSGRNSRAPSCGACRTARYRPAPRARPRNDVSAATGNSPVVASSSLPSAVENWLVSGSRSLN